MAPRLPLLLLAPCLVAGMELALRHGLATARHPRLPATNPRAPPPPPRVPGPANCTVRNFTQFVDHFSWVAPPAGTPTFEQRVFVCDYAWDRSANGSVFFYAGNESPVDNYVTHTGLMYENAARFGARVVFAEHRYYGTSLPFGDASPLFPQYMTHEQALADYVTLLSSLQKEAEAEQPVIVFGGSYGGKLAAWARMRYPATFAGAIAASAPILGFTGSDAAKPLWDTSAYWKVVTRDATAAAGAAPACAANVQAAWPALVTAAGTAAGRANLTTTLKLCSPPPAGAEVALIALYLNAWDTCAMGNFPYPSNYLTNGGPLLPAYPVRVMCDALADPGLAGGDPWALLRAFGAAADVFNNATQDVACYELPTDVWLDGIWDYQWCTELLPEETYFTRGQGGDMFPPFTYDLAAITAHCQAAWGVTPRFDWVPTSYGGVNGVRAASRIAFSNGAYDPWSTGGVVNVTLGPDVPTIWIADGAHHVDLFYANDADPPSITRAREQEMNLVAQWIAAWRAERGHR